MTTPEMPSAQECKAKAVQLLHQRAGFERSRREKRMSSEDRYYSLGMLDEAQVWATLATVPEPLEALEVHGQLIESSTAGPIIPIPKLMCPHGMQARIVTSVDDPDSARYTWQPDCPQGCP